MGWGGETFGEDAHLPRPWSLSPPEASRAGPSGVPHCLFLIPSHSFTSLPPLRLGSCGLLGPVTAASHWSPSVCFPRWSGELLGRGCAGESSPHTPSPGLSFSPSLTHFLGACSCPGSQLGPFDPTPAPCPVGSSLGKGLLLVLWYRPPGISEPWRLSFCGVDLFAFFASPSEGGC